jgi:Na+-transporting methylmalonyl-CoA/oxaloacetate decarboxylase gamma subunit
LKKYCTEIFKQILNVSYFGIFREIKQKAKEVFIMSSEFVAAVVLTGFTVVFLGLILLIIFMKIMGLAFVKTPKKPKDETKPSALAQSSQPAKSSAPVAVVTAPVAPATQAPDFSVIAAISAAVAMMAQADGTQYEITSVTPVLPAISLRQRNAWAMAGVYQNTRPF